jgi:hypothetical protein
MWQRRSIRTVVSLPMDDLGLVVFGVVLVLVGYTLTLGPVRAVLWDVPLSAGRVCRVGACF